MVEVYALDHKGRGIAKQDNKIIFIENALENEIVDINIIKSKKNYNEATVKSYIKKSEDRIESICPYFSKCGGCDLLHLDYNKQLDFKQNKIKNIIEKYLNKNIKISKIVKSDNTIDYRNKVTFQINNNIGFFRKDSNELISIDECKMASNVINNSIKYLKELDLSKIKTIICRTNEKDLMIIIETNNNNLNIDPIKEVSSSIYFKINNKYILKYGKDKILQTVGEYKYLVSSNSFFQINSNVCEKMYNKIKEIVGENKKVLDLYCGTGTIGIYISKNNEVLGVEINESAIKDAIKNKDLNKLSNIDFICNDSGKQLNKLNFIPDTIIIDPPRSGLNIETLNNILNLEPKSIIYVSCDPMTLVRDLKRFNNKYKIVEITPFDMFPNTYHCENVCILERK